MKKLISTLSFSILLLSGFATGVVATATGTNPTCYGSCNGSATAMAGGGIGPYGFTWTGPSSYSAIGANISGLCAGTYVVTAIDSSDMSTAQYTINLTQPSLFVSTANNSGPICGGSIGNLYVAATGGTPPYSYSWNPATTLSNPSINNPTANPAMTTSYTATVTDNSGCTSTASTILTVNPNPVVTVNSPTICAGQPAVLIAGGATTYSWNTGTTSNPYTVIPATTTTYTVTGTSSGCSATAISTVTVNSSPVVSVSPTAANCGMCNGSFTTSAPGGTTFSWSGPSGFTSNTANPSALCAGTYTLTSTGSNGCSSTQSSTITNISSVTATVGSIVPANCGASDGSASVVVTGGTAPYTYLWSPTGNTTATGTGLAAGTYTVTVTDMVGCSFTLVLTVPSNSTLTGTTTVSPTACGACNGSANITPSGGTGPYTYNWSPGALSGQGTPVISNLCTGTYTVIVTDANGCNYNATTTVTNTNPVYVTANYTGSTCGACNGTATVIATGGVTPYLYSLNGGAQQSSGNFSGLCPGVYADAVTDVNGCVGTYYVTIPSMNATTFTVTDVIQNETGSGLNNGSIDLTVSSAAGPYTFAWSNGATTEDIYSLGAGSYSVVITDNSGQCGTYYYSITAASTSGYITGYIYNDNNSNCIYDGGDSPLNGYYVQVSNGTSTYYGYTNTAGYYNVWVPAGNYTVTPWTYTNISSSCTNTYTVNVTSGSTITNNNIAYNVPPVYDVCVYTWCNGIVPGFNGYYNVYLYNNGNQSADGVVYLVLPSLLNYVSSSPATTSISGDTIFWNYTGLAGYASQSYVVTFNTPPSAVLGTPTISYSHASLTNGVDANPACNSYTYTRIVSGSFDPNEKTVSPSGYGATGDIPLTETDFSYLINFQNTGSGPAVNISVTDTLSSLLDPMSFQMLDASHDYTVEMLPGNIIRWNFDNIMLPDSASNQAASHGHVQFKIHKLNSPVAGQMIQNKAYIYFDFNAPVITNTAINTYELAAGIEGNVADDGSVSVYPNPFSEQTTFVISTEKNNETYTFVMTDVLGKTFRLMKTNEKQFTISRNGLEEGMYFYNITDSKGIVGKGKVVIK